MKLRALVSFTGGMLTVARGREFELKDDKLAKDLIKAKYAEPVAGNTNKGGSGSNTTPTPPQTTPPAVKDGEEGESPEAEKTEEDDKAPAAPTSESKSGAEKGK